MRVVGITVLLALGANVTLARDWPTIPAADTARLKARVMCSCLFVQQLSMDQCSDGASAIWRYPFATAPKLLATAEQRLSVTVEPAGKSVRLLSGEKILAESHFIDDGGGCVTGARKPVNALEERKGTAARIAPVPLARGSVPSPVNAQALEQTLTEGFSEQGPFAGQARVALIVYQGRVVTERYAPGFGPHNQYYLGSVAKIFNNLLAALLVRDGKLGVNDAVKLPEWSGANDPRAAITFDHLLHMTSGIAWEEDFFNPGAPAYDIFFAGSAGMDVARFMAARKLEAEPGKHLEYSTGSADLLSRALQSRLDGPPRRALLDYFSRELFAPLGITGLTPEFDPAGTFLAGHSVYSRPEDLARIGLMLLNDGRWGERRILPEGWVAYSIRANSPDDWYGAHLMLNMAGVPGCFGHRGVGDQFLIVCPKRNLVVVWFSSVFDFNRAPSDPAAVLKPLISAFPE